MILDKMKPRKDKTSEEKLKKDYSRDRTAILIQGENHDLVVYLFYFNNFFSP